MVDVSDDGDVAKILDHDGILLGKIGDAL